ncbi:DNA-3-methyladenine glycosylase family protein [Microbacterium karelineae]|uniref:DNA-3-methyladenine glycosylase family protein n=1 Tax=Microbacterium karelineae TaxID=2654283 RepID=UPI0012E9DC1F|nr:DNA-3-methyladenine glycosylase 2 family protein [Microbacterium karelineae]
MLTTVRESPLQARYAPRGPLDLRVTVGSLQRGPGDPTQALAGGVIWRAVRTPDGVATLALSQLADGSVRTAAWGPGRERAIAQVPALCGAGDDVDEFDASHHPLIAEAHRRHPGLRLTRTDAPFEALAQAVIEQKVTVRQAFGAWRRLVAGFGERAPGPSPRALFAPPPAEAWRRIPSWAWHRAGLEPPQARTLVRAAARGASLERALATAPSGDARGAVLTSLPGVGPWTAAETRIRAFGDPDAVSVGDFHLAHHVGSALAGSRTDDDGMLALLEPWRGQRQRVIRLILAAGVVEPRRGPRLHVEDHRAR